MELVMIRRTGEIKNISQGGKVKLGQQVSLACHI